MKIKAAVVDKQGEPMTIQEMDIREPLDNEVRVKIVGAGVCHTDIAHANNEWNIPLPMPMVMGHEGAGIVESVGPASPRSSLATTSSSPTPPAASATPATRARNGTANSPLTCTSCWTAWTSSALPR